MFGYKPKEPFKNFTVITGKNLFNPATTIPGYVISKTTGALVVSANFSTSDYIPVKPHTNYVRAGSFQYAFYNSAKTFISGGESGIMLAPANAAYLRLYVLTSGLNTFQVEVGEVPTAVEAYQTRYVYNEVPRIIIPHTIYAVVGRETNVYFDNLIFDDAAKYDWDITCTKGTHQNERWTYTPEVADVGTIAFKIAIYKDGILLDTATASIVVIAADAKNSTAISGMIIGDSTSAGGAYMGEVRTLVGVDSIALTQLGTVGTAPNLCEAYSGKDINWFYTHADSPFTYSGVFNFAQYLTDNGYTAPDMVFINMGVNDEFIYLDDASALAKAATVITQLDAIIANIKVSNANVRIGIAVTIPPSKNQDSFGASYASDQSKWRYKRNNLLWIEQLINYYSAKTSTNIYLVPINVNLDTVNNMNVETVAVNSRNSATVVRQNNSVHPATIGYYQIADSVYNWIKAYA